jgi:hypothetical protein
MQTFLPYPSFSASAECLDNQRLGKQRVECMQILKAISTPSYGWQSHPAVQMWRGYEASLKRYSLVICAIWMERGFNDTCFEKIAAMPVPDGPAYPHWRGDDAFHRSHKSNLIRKRPDIYRPLWPNIPDDLPYLWPNGLTQ